VRNAENDPRSALARSAVLANVTMAIMPVEPTRHLLGGEGLLSSRSRSLARQRFVVCCRENSLLNPPASLRLVGLF